MNIDPQPPAIQPLQYYERPNDDLRPVVRLLLLAGGVSFSTSAASTAISVANISPRMFRGISGSNLFQLFFRLLGPGGTALALAIGCTLCLIGIRARLFTYWCAWIVIAFRLASGILTTIEFVGMFKGRSSSTALPLPNMISQQMIGAITGCVLPLLLIGVLSRRPVRDLLDRAG